MEKSHEIPFPHHIMAHRSRGLAIVRTVTHLVRISVVGNVASNSRLVALNGDGFLRRCDSVVFESSKIATHDGLVQVIVLHDLG